MGLRLRSWFGAGEREGAAGSAPRAGTAPASPVGIEEAPRSAAGQLRGEFDRRLVALADSAEPGPVGDRERALLDHLRGDIQTVVRRPPGAIQRALETCRDPDASLKRIADTFARDPALAQALLKHANSSFYMAAGVGCSSLNDAAQRIGQSGLLSVLMASLVESLLVAPGGPLGIMVQQVWTHLVRTAPLARRLAPVGGQPSEPAYALGLLHDFGKLIILDRAAASESAAGGPRPLPPAFLSRVLRDLHGPLGGLAVLNWGLDDAAARAVASHPRTDLRFDGDRMSEVLCLAEWADLTEVREEVRDYQAFWRRAGLTLPLEPCRELLDDGGPAA